MSQRKPMPKVYFENSITLVRFFILSINSARYKAWC